MFIINRTLKKPKQTEAHLRHLFDVEQFIYALILYTSVQSYQFPPFRILWHIDTILITCWHRVTRPLFQLYRLIALRESFTSLLLTCRWLLSYLGRSRAGLFALISHGNKTIHMVSVYLNAVYIAIKSSYIKPYSGNSPK